MNKQWLYSAIAGIALLATACGNNAASPDTNRYGTMANNGSGYSYGDYMARSNNLVGGYSGTMGSRHNGTYGTGSNNTAFGVDRTTGYYGAASNNTAFRGAGYGATGYGTTGYGMNGYGGTTYNTRGFGYGTDGTYGIRAGDQANYRMNTSIYKTGTDGVGNGNNFRTAGTAGTGGNGQTGTASRMGYARMDVNYVRANSDALSQFHVDRDALAQVVGNVTCSVPGVSTSTVLVTDEEIFVGVNLEGKNANTAKPKVRMNAMSVSPRWFKVYVTDNKNMIDEMTRIYSRASNVNVASPQDDRQIDNLIRSFGGSTDSDHMKGRRDANRSMTGTNTAGYQDSSTTGRNAGTSMGGGAGATSGAGATNGAGATGGSR